MTKNGVYINESAEGWIHYVTWESSYNLIDNTNTITISSSSQQDIYAAFVGDLLIELNGESLLKLSNVEFLKQQPVKKTVRKTIKMNNIGAGQFSMRYSAGNLSGATKIYVLNKESNGCIKINGFWRMAFAWIKTILGWKRCIIWRKINGIWKRGK